MFLNFLWVFPIQPSTTGVSQGQWPSEILKIPSPPPPKEQKSIFGSRNRKLSKILSFHQLSKPFFPVISVKLDLAD